MSFGSDPNLLHSSIPNYMCNFYIQCPLELKKKSSLCKKANPQEIWTIISYWWTQFEYTASWLLLSLWQEVNRNLHLWHSFIDCSVKKTMFLKIGDGRSKGKFKQYLRLQDLNQSVLGFRALRPRDRAHRKTVLEPGTGLQLSYTEFTSRIWVDVKENLSTSTNSDSKISFF